MYLGIYDMGFFICGEYYTEGVWSTSGTVTIRVDSLYSKRDSKAYTRILIRKKVLNKALLEGGKSFDQFLSGFV